MAEKKCTCGRDGLTGNGRPDLLPELLRWIPGGKPRVRDLVTRMTKRKHGM